MHKFANGGRASSCSPLIQTSSNIESEIVKVSSITIFFYDDPTMPYAPLPDHDLDQSPCYPIIAQKQGYFYLLTYSMRINILIPLIPFNT
jgi:hypothetical protein